MDLMTETGCEHPYKVTSCRGAYSSSTSSTTLLGSRFTDVVAEGFVPSLPDLFRDSLGFYSYKETGLAQRYSGGGEGGGANNRWVWQQEVEEENWATADGGLENLLELLPKTSDLRQKLVENLDIFAVGLAVSLLHHDAFLLFMTVLSAVVMGGLFGPVMSTVSSSLLLRMIRWT